MLPATYLEEYIEGQPLPEGMNKSLTPWYSKRLLAPPCRYPFHHTYIVPNYMTIEHPTGKAKVLYSYAGQSSEELSVEMGETVDIMDKPDPLWWRVRSEQGIIGMLPSTYLEEVGGESTSG